MDHKTFNSAATQTYLELNAPYYNAVNPTTVTFTHEQISVFINSLGHIEFFDMTGQSLGFVDIPAAESPDMYAHSGQYGTVRCSADGHTVRILLPVYEWIDHYPNCDGESDRWSRRCKRWFEVAFDCAGHEITISGR